MTKKFPVNKLSYSIPEKGLHVAKHGEGTRIAYGVINLQDASISGLTAEINADKSYIDKAEKVKRWIEEGLKFLKDHTKHSKDSKASNEISQALESPRTRGSESAPRIEFLKNHDCLMDIQLPASSIQHPASSIQHPASSIENIRCDIDVTEELDTDGIEVLYALGLMYTFSYVSESQAEMPVLTERAALNNVISFWERLEEDDRNCVAKILSQPHIDAGNVFLRFLQSSANQSQHEKDKLIAWLRCRSQIDLPYDDTDIIKALEEERDLAALRIRIYNAINDTYAQDVDTENADRIAEMCMENGMRIVAGRFSRALYIDAMLMANARVIETGHLKDSISELENLVKSSTLSFEDLPQKSGMPGDFSRIGGEMQTIVNMVGEKTVSQAQIQGAVSRLKKALREFETYCLEKLDTGYSMLDAGYSMLINCISEIRNKVEQIFQGISKIEISYLTAPKKEPVYLIFLQRIHPLDAINMGMMNQLADPFFGEDEEVHEIMRGCGHLMYTTANLRGWLRKCDDWIEALPAYAEYEIIPQKTDSGSYNVTTFVWRAILEEMYKQHAEDWAINIEEVTALEHIALAREMLVEESGLENEVDVIVKKNHVSKEEAVRQIVKQKRDEIAYIAAIIDAASFDMCDQIARRVEAQGISRMEAVRQLIAEGQIVIPDQKQTTIKLFEKKFNQTFSHFEEKFKKLATNRRRELPNVHVLTTLGPGETENVENWLEEAMTLFNVSRAYDLESTDVQERISDYKKRIYHLSEKIVQEMDLEGDLYNITQTEGLISREKAVMRLIEAYPEVAEKVTELAVLIEYEEKLSGRPIDPQNTHEPSVVLSYISSHPELNDIFTNENNVELWKSSIKFAQAFSKLEEEKHKMKISIARGKIIASLKLNDKVRNYLRDHQPERLGTVTARREVIAENGLSRELENPKFRYESYGPLKRYNLLYTPSRVDLGIDEVESVKNVPKWIGGRDRQAANAGKSLYSLYNLAGPTAMPATKFAEFLKVGENFFSRGGVFYLSLAAGANLDALGIGDFEFFRDQWNMRGDRIVLPGGETYGGFCVPKEFTLLYAVILAALEPRTSREILNAFGVPEELHLMDELREILQMRLQFDSVLDWEAKATEILVDKFEREYIPRLPRLATTLESKGIIASDDEKDMIMGYRLASWINKKAHGMEEVNRSGPFRKVHLIYRLAKEARKKNPAVAPDGELIGVMGAPYKEGGRKDGKEVPITDVRFGSGARKLEIYAGTAEGHLLKHIDPEGSEIIKSMFKDFQTPADIRIVGTCTASDILNHVPRSGLPEIAETVNERLLEAGLSQDIIDANCQIYGGCLDRWVDIKEMPESQRKTLIDEIGGHIHLLVLSRRGVFRTYANAIQGVDFIDLGIPDPELLDLVDDLPRLLYLMRKGRPSSALVFADGTSGARRRTFSYRYVSSKRKVKELFALDDNAVYGALGLGMDTVESWRQEMIRERQFAQDLFDSIIHGDYTEAERVYANVVEYVRQEGKAEEAAQDEIMARKLKVPLEDYRCVSDCLGKVKCGLALGQLDFGTWLILGGMYILNGKASADEISTIREQFEDAVDQLRNIVNVERIPLDPPLEKGDTGAGSSEKKDLRDWIIKRFVRPKYEPSIHAELYREIETGIAGSLKAAEEKAGRLQKRETRRREAIRAANMAHRKEAFEEQRAKSEERRAEGILSLELLYRNAMENVGDGRSEISQEDFGRFLAWLEAAFSAFGVNLSAHPVIRMFTTMEVDDEAYMALASNLAMLAVSAKGDRSHLEAIAMVMELLDIALVIEKNLDMESPEDMSIALARFYDTTINSHIFDYIPYHYHKQRGDGFESLTREEKLGLAERRHRWLYTYTRHQMVTKTELKNAGRDYQDAWLGDADRGIMGLGVNVEDKREQFWFNYARLRDAMVLRHEGYPFPEIFNNLDPKVLKCDKNANVVIVYPHGNTTVPVALEQGAKLAQENINLMLCPFPYIEYDEKYGREVLRVPDAFMYISEDDYKEVLKASGVRQERQGSDKQCVLIAARFREPIIAHGIFFHFTHPMRPDIGSVGAPLIQPLIWEAATHLKCRLPDMLKGSGVRTADQINWYKHQSAELSESEAKKRIRQALRQFAEKHSQLIAKPEKESGGRMARILPVRQDGQVLEENIDELADVVYNISKVDNVAIQDVLPSYVKRLYSREFLVDMVDRFARIGVPVLLDREPQTPLYSYFRQVVVLGRQGYETTHHITVISTRGVANVGQGGILYEYRDEIINPRYREDMRREITHAAMKSLESQRHYIREHWWEILREYLRIHPEFANKVKMAEPGVDLTGFSDADIPYEMGDYMPVFLVDENDNLVRIFDKEKEEMIPLFNEDGSRTDVDIYDESGHAIPRVDENGLPVPVPMFDESGNRIPRFDREGNPISTLVIYKIEPNPGAGLWRPHNDQLPEKRKGEGVFKIFKCLGERAQVYRDKLNK